jgi:trans-2,3-dihydro-3-hydroxyanthranilate isomerase
VRAGPRTYRLRWVDVFTERALAGNPLAVVLAADGLSDASMQAIARETNLSETTFVLPPVATGHTALVRIFTPFQELPFAGHPTIGTAWVLLDEGLVEGKASTFTLEEGVGPVPVRVERAQQMRLWMRHPAVKFAEIIEQRDDLATALGLTHEDLVPEVPIQIASTGVPFLYVALRDRGAVDRAVSSGEQLTLVLDPHGLPPVFLFAVVGPGRLYSRMFPPHAGGLTEDPATGSASGPLGAFVVRYGLAPRARHVSLISEQGTKMGRQSFVHINLEYPADASTPSPARGGGAGWGPDPTLIEVGGSVVPVLDAQLRMTE